jgi:hypothetical protein
VSWLCLAAAVRAGRRFARFTRRGGGWCGCRHAIIMETMHLQHELIEFDERIHFSQFRVRQQRKYLFSRQPSRYRLVPEKVSIRSTCECRKERLVVVLPLSAYCSRGQLHQSGKFFASTCVSSTATTPAPLSILYGCTPALTKHQ